MKVSNLWKFVGTNIISLTTVFVGIAVILLNQLNVIPSTSVPSTILALLALLATSEIVESRTKLSKLEEGLEGLSRQISETVQGVRTLTFATSDEALEYAAKRIRESRQSVDQASIDYLRHPRQTPARERFEDTRNETILANHIKYRYLGVLHSKRRLDFAQEHIVKHKLNNFYAGFYSKSFPEIPLLSFLIIDKTEVFARYPYELGDDSGYIAIKSPYVAGLFLGYFNRLWAGCQKLETEEDYIRLSSSVDR